MRGRVRHAMAAAAAALCLVAVAGCAGAGGGSAAVEPSPATTSPTTRTPTSTSGSASTPTRATTSSSVPGSMSSSASSSASGSASGSTSTLAPSPSGPLAPGSLSGVTIVLNPGHNGGNAGAARDVAVPIDAGGFTKPCDTTGTETGDGYPEHAFTFDVATRTAALLQAAGAVVVLTRPDDSGVGPCLDQRARIANDAAPAAVVHIHADGGPPDGTGFHVIGPALAPDGANAAILDPSSRLAVTLRDQFALTTGEPFASYIGEAGLDVRSDLAGMNLSTAPAVFIECGNMRNADEAARMEDPQWRALAAEGIARGIGAFVAAGG